MKEAAQRQHKDLPCLTVSLLRILIYMILFDLNLSLSIIEPQGEGHLNGLLKARLQIQC